MEFIIGRNHTTPFAIDESKTAVSGSHVKITVSDDRKTWMLEDLNSANGTYVRGADGEFRREYKCHITEDTVIRLGDVGFTSFTFMAHRVIEQNQGNYNYEFARLRRLYNNLKQEIADRESINKSHRNLAKYAPIVGLGLSFAIPMDYTWSMMGVRMAIVVPTFCVSWLTSGDADKLKEILNRKAKLMVCPKCGVPLSDHFVVNRFCPSCKAR